MTVRYPRHVLGVDPGTHFCGWALIDVPRPGSYAARGLGTLVIPGGSLHRRLGRLLEDLEPIVARARDLLAECVVEQPWIGGTAEATLGIASARGVALALIGRAGLRFSQYLPQVWRAVTGDARSDKIRTAYIVKQLLRLTEDPPLDAAEAAGMALFHATRG